MIVRICGGGGGRHRARERGGKREGRQERGEREPKGREDPRTGGQQEDTVHVWHGYKKRRMNRCEDTKNINIKETAYDLLPLHSHNFVTVELTLAP